MHSLCYRYNHIIGQMQQKLIENKAGRYGLLPHIFLKGENI